MIGRSLALVVVAAALACGREAPPPVAAPAVTVADAEPFSDAWLLAQADRYLNDPAARRTALERSLRNHDNTYSRMRLDAYARGEFGWDLLPVWNPRVQPITRATGEALAAGRALDLGATAPLWDGVQPTTMPEWIALGRAVFFSYPLRPEVFAEHALVHPQVAREIGLHSADDGEVPGVVAFLDIDGQARVGITCALCHTTIENGAVVAGRARRDFDYGRMRLAYHRDTGIAVDPELARRMGSWGPGRADITEDDDEDPVAIPDLWGLRSLESLTQAATLRHGSLGADAPLALAIRQETQILHANRERTRPPRELAYALAMYLYSLAPPPAATSQDPAVARGEATFRRDCVDCHSDPGGSGPALAAGDIGTDPALAHGVSRGTGLYRPAPLLRVADAAPYLHHGVVADLPQMFDPARLRADYDRGARGPGPVPGHLPGTDLSPAERADLIAYLRTL